MRRLNGQKPPLEFKLACQRWGVLPTRWCLVVSVRRQEMVLFQQAPPAGLRSYQPRRTFRISTSRFGLGQRKDSNQTPLGLHRIAEKHGGGYPIGAVFASREFQGYTWQGLPDGQIVHRILWLQGLEPGFNQGGAVDTYERYIYIHGFGDARTLGQPASHGCIHLAPGDLLPLFDFVPLGTLVWISESW
jgi:lipoprotein-anchoring transpeptidase ErfK/SrfK